MSMPASVRHLKTYLLLRATMADAPHEGSGMADAQSNGCAPAILAGSGIADAPHCTYMPYVLYIMYVMRYHARHVHDVYPHIHDTHDIHIMYVQHTHDTVHVQTYPLPLATVECSWHLKTASQDIPAIARHSRMAGATPPAAACHEASRCPPSLLPAERGGAPGGARSSSRRLRAGPCVPPHRPISPSLTHSISLSLFSVSLSLFSVSLSLFSASLSVSSHSWERYGVSLAPPHAARRTRSAAWPQHVAQATMNTGNRRRASHISNGSALAKR
jgi:hypothetical protein